MLIRGVKNKIRVFVHELLRRILDESVERIELLTDETFYIEETRDGRPAILLCYLFIVLVLHFVSGVGVSIPIVGIRVLSRNEIQRVRRQTNTNEDQYTPWLITISIGVRLRC